MQDEIQNNNHGWRASIHSLDALPGEPAPAFSASWEKLHSRLEIKKRNIAPVIWLIAVACAIAVIFLLTIDQPEKVKSVNAVKNEASATAIANQEQPKILLPPQTAVVNQKPVHAKKALQKTKLQQPINDENPIIQIPTPPIKTSIEITNIAKSEPAPTRKMRVMHVNELEPTGEEIQEKLAQQEKTRHSKSNNLIKSYVSNSTSDKVLKITISPSN